MNAYPQRVESGPWFSAGEQLDGAEAYRRILAVDRCEDSARRPYCVYVHVPFCATICRFCALYTFGVSGSADAVFDKYLDHVCRSLHDHPWNGSAVPPTTVHFGGGTPLSLGLRRFETLVRSLRDAFGTSPACEWAIETTTSSLNEPTVETLEAFGFRRIHLGIQTLHNETRRRIGRRETGDQAIERIRALGARGHAVSVDLIIGFEGVDPRIINSDLERLHAAGVRMFSICELRERGRARLGIQDERIKARLNRTAWQTIWTFMEEAGLPPIHHGQFGRNQADNLYFTHPARHEDCVAIGPYAHGSVEDVSYGNRLLPEYYDAIDAGESPIAMGVDYRAGERVIRDLERELLAHAVRRPTLDRVVDSYPSTFGPVLDFWMSRGLLRDRPGQASLALTADGSWFVGNMIDDIRALAEPTSAHSRYA